jgi:hypothetical protein
MAARPTNMDQTENDYRQVFQELRHSTSETISKERMFRDLKITSADRIQFASFLNSPIAEDFFAGLLRYFDSYLSAAHQGQDNIISSWSLKIGHGKFSIHEYESLQHDSSEKRPPMDLSAAYRGVLVFGSNLRFLSRDRAFFELFYQFCKAICSKFKPIAPAGQVVTRIPLRARRANPTAIEPPPLRSRRRSTASAAPTTSTSRASLTRPSRYVWNFQIGNHAS